MKNLIEELKVVPPIGWAGIVVVALACIGGLYYYHEYLSHLG